jgi:hypothetical protein
MGTMRAPFYTIEKGQAERCKRACRGRTTLTEVFPTGKVTGQVKSVVDHPDATPMKWSITFIKAT